MRTLKILVVGCGSIGRRHAKNAYSLGAEISLCDSNEDRMSSLAKDVNAKVCFSSYEEAALISDADAVVISTPSNLHALPAKMFIEKHKHIFMEKPLCIDLESAYELRAQLNKTHVVFMMAHTYRFRDEWIKIKRLIDKLDMGKINSAESIGGWYLPDWHIHENYRHEYAAQRIMGGGVLTTSLSHIFDLVMWLFGDIEKMTGSKMRLGDLDIDVDDTFVCTMKTDRGISVTAIEDFLSRSPRRTLRVNTEYGYMKVDFNKQNIKIWDSRDKRFLPNTVNELSNGSFFKVLEDGVLYDLKEDKTKLGYSGNDAYVKEMEHFFNLVSNQDVRHDLDIDSGIKVLECIYSSEIKDWQA